MDVFPSSVIARSTIVVPDPDVNTEWSYTVGGGGQESQPQGVLLRAVSGSIQQGVGQTPQPLLRIADPAGHVIYESFGSSSAMAASTTCRFSWASLLPLSAPVGATTNVHATAPLPDELYLPSGYVLSSVTLGKGAATQWTGVVIFGVVCG